MLDHYEKTSFAEDWFLDTSGTRLSSDQYLRKSILLNNYEIKKMIDAGKKVCYVFGFDKITYIVWFLLSEIWYLTEVLQKL